MRHFQYTVVGTPCHAPSTAAATNELDLADASGWVVMRNNSDSVGALAALHKGCSSSTFLQKCAMLLAMLHRKTLCHPLFKSSPARPLL